MTQRPRFVATEIAAWIESDHHFAKDGGSGLYIWRNGVYAPGADEVVSELCLGYFEMNNRADDWTSHRANEVLKRIRIRANPLWTGARSDVINLKNGLLDVETLTLRSHSPEHLSTLQIPVEYDPAAKCPAWDRFIGQVLPGCESLFWEIVGYVIVPDSLSQKMLLFYGSGGNGKSTLLRGVENLLGRNNVSNISLQDLASDRFAIAELRGKLANICGDLPARPVSEPAMIKRLTGGDELSAQFKYGKHFKFRSFAKLLFSANQLPKVNDTSDGFWDRLLIVPMEKRIRTTGAEMPQEVLLAKLREPQELSGALNQALEGRARLTRNKRFSEPPRSRELLDKLRGIVSPIAQFLVSETREVSTGQVEPQALCARYNDWAQKKGYPEKTAVQLGKELAKLRPKVHKVRRGPKDDQRYVYEGLELNEINSDLSSPRR